MLTLASLLSILFGKADLADDIGLVGVVICVVWLYGTLVLAERRSLIECLRLAADGRRPDAREGKTMRNCPLPQLKENPMMARKAKAANERFKVKNLPQKEQKLSKGEQKRVKGGIDGALNNHQTGALRNLSNNNTYDGCQQSTDGIIGR